MNPTRSSSRWIRSCVALAALLSLAACEKKREPEQPKLMPPKEVVPAWANHPSVAVLPLVGENGQPGWLGMAVADLMTNRLLVQSKADPVTKESKYPLDVFSWRQSLGAARGEGIAAADFMSRAADLRMQLGAAFVLGGSWSVTGDTATLHWQMTSARGSQAYDRTCEVGKVAQTTYEVAAQILSVLAPGFDRKIEGGAFQPLPAAALQIYGQALELLASQSLDPRARLILSRAELENAATLLESVTKTSPTSAAAWTLRAVVASMLKDFKAAEEDLVQAAMHKDDPEPSTALATYYVYSVQKNPAALKTLEDTVATFPGSLQALGYLGDAYLRERRFSDASRIFGIYTRRAPNNPWAQMRFASVLSRLGKHDEALKKAEGLVARSPTSVAAVAALVSRQIDAGKLDAARATLTKELAAHPDDPTLLTRMSYLELDANKPAEALALADKAIGLMGGAGRGESLAGYAHIDKAHALALMGKNDEAVAAIDTATELGVGPDEVERLMRDPRLKAFLEDPKCPIGKAK
ncbi:MAG TPA: tetratricopeptide repeat protein [Myxococcales bacterium]